MAVKKLEVPAATIAEQFYDEVFVDNDRALWLWRGVWYVWAKTHYKPIKAGYIEKKLTVWMRQCEDYYDFAGISAVMKPIMNNLIATSYLCSELEAPFIIDMELGHGGDFDIVGGECNLIPVKNGLLDIKKAMRGDADALRPHDSSFFYTNVIPCDYDPKAVASNFAEFLEFTFNGDESLIKLIQEMFGYCLYHDLQFHTIFLFAGEGGNGKSVLLDLLSDFLGIANISTVPLKDFKEKFALYQTLGKFANISADEDKLTDCDEGKLKKFVGQDLTTFERKHADAFTARPSGRLIVSCNNEPRFKDRSEGIWRRMILIKCLQKIPKDKQIDRLHEIIFNLEHPGMLNFAIAGAARLEEARMFTKSEQVEKWIEEYRNDLNPCRTFLLEECAPCVGEEITSEVLYKAYKDFIEDDNRGVLSKGEFGKELKRLYPKVKRVRLWVGGITRTRKWGYRGLMHLGEKSGEGENSENYIPL